MTLSVEQVALEALSPHPDNPRRSDPAGIAESLMTNGQYKPIVVSRDDVILAGHHTVRAAESLGWATLDAVRLPVDGSSDAARRVMLADNRTTDLAGYDDRTLAGLLSELAASDEGLLGTAWDADDYSDLLATVRRADTPRVSHARVTYEHVGEHGTEVQTASFAQLASSYADQATRSLVLEYPLAEYAEVTDALTAYRESNGLESNAEAVLAICRTVARA